MIKLKLLSGPFAGLEYNLENGDTVLHLVRDVANTAIAAGASLAAAENVLLVATDAECGRIIVRCTLRDGIPEIALSVQDDAATDAPVFTRAPLNAPVCHLGLYLVIAAPHAVWSEEVLHFIPPHQSIVSEAGPRGRPVAPRKRGWLPLALVGGSLIVAAAGGIAYYLHLPEVQAGKLSAALSQAPGRYEVVADDERNLYVFADDTAAAAWAERAVRRADRWKAKVMVRQDERERIEGWLIRRGLQPVIVRLNDPAGAEIVLNGVPSESMRERVLGMARNEMPYAHHLKVTGVTDAALVNIARDELKTLGVITRSDIVGGRTSISNTVFLDDAALASMAAYSRQFEQRWGARRVTVNARLWDDVLRGRSFRYAPGQLMSVGQGRWEYSEHLR
jgi:hypothetical protein